MTTQKHSKIKNCIKCNVKLIEGLNWWKSRKNSRNYICNKCDWKSSKPRMQKYIREKVVFSKKLLRGQKRKRTTCCELCKRKEIVKGKKIRLYYHHWDDNNLLKGVYVCSSCHHFIHKFENKKFDSKCVKLKIELGYDIKWSKLKNKIIGVKPCIISSD